MLHEHVVDLYYLENMGDFTTENKLLSQKLDLNLKQTALVFVLIYYS